ncbi:MAG: nucleotidyltransferase family protein [Myxococcota bacterium]|jgi:hypothetical protein|nr:nucleotidyltransferase family protein [Myxococcota bacterium]
MTLHGIEFPLDRIARFCQTSGIKRFALFGSILRDDFGPESDIDVLVEFYPGVKVGLSLFRLQDELSAMLGRRVDLNTVGFLSPHFRDEVLEKAEPVYVAA